MPRFFCDTLFATGDVLALPEGAARHVQVLRLQPGAEMTLFNGQGGEWRATVEHMGRSEVRVKVGAHADLEREAHREVHLACGMPANERMDWLVEKATELGVSSIQPLLTERTVLRLQGERARKKVAHWQNIAAASSEQCGRNRVPVIHDVMAPAAWLDIHRQRAHGIGLLLSLRSGARPLLDVCGPSGSVTLLSGPEGGFGAQEEESAIAAGFVPVTLGTRTLRAETAPLAVLAALTLGR